MGGILILLFGSIAAVGMNTLIKAQIDLGEQRNLVIVATVLVFGIGGMVVGQGEMSLQGVALSGFAAIILNLILPRSTADTDDLGTEKALVDELLKRGH
jgi:uracil permease